MGREGVPRAGKTQRCQIPNCLVPTPGSQHKPQAKIFTPVVLNPPKSVLLGAQGWGLLNQSGFFAGPAAPSTVKGSPRTSQQETASCPGFGKL